MDLAVGTILLALVAARSLVYRFEAVVEAVQGEIVLKPPLNAGAGIGTFTNPDAAINDNEFDGAQSALSVSCTQTCLTEVENVTVWQGFPNGAEPLRLEVSWDGSGGIPPGVQAQAYFLVEYDIGSGWQVGEEDLWVNSIPSCSPRPSRPMLTSCIREAAERRCDSQRRQSPGNTPNEDDCLPPSLRSRVL